MEEREREPMLGRSTDRLERRVSTRRLLQPGGSRAKPLTTEYKRSNTPCSSTQKISLSDRSNARPAQKTHINHTHTHRTRGRKRMASPCGAAPLTNSSRSAARRDETSVQVATHSRRSPPSGSSSRSWREEGKTKGGGDAIGEDERPSPATANE